METMTYEEVNKYLKDNDLYGEISQPFYKSKYMADKVYEIEIEGDWKHTHLYLKWLFEQKGYVQTKEEITEEDGSDWYGSKHTFMAKDMYELFKPKKD